MPVAVNDIFAVALVQKLFNQTVINTFAMQVAAVGTQTDEVAWMAGMCEDATGFLNQADHFRRELILDQSNEVTHSHWLIQKVKPTPTAQYLFPIVTNNVGTVASTCESANLALAVNRKGTGPGRRNRGRIAVAGLPVANMAAGVWLTTALSDYGGWIQYLIGNQAAGDALGNVLFGFYSPEHTGTVKGLPVTYPAQFVWCRSAQARETVRVQRSRTIGVGR